MDTLDLREGDIAPQKRRPGSPFAAGWQHETRSPDAANQVTGPYVGVSADHYSVVQQSGGSDESVVHLWDAGELSKCEKLPACEGFQPKRG